VIAASEEIGTISIDTSRHTSIPPSRIRSTIRVIVTNTRATASPRVVKKATAIARKTPTSVNVADVTTSRPRRALATIITVKVEAGHPHRQASKTQPLATESRSLQDSAKFLQAADSRLDSPRVHHLLGSTNNNQMEQTTSSKTRPKVKAMAIPRESLVSGTSENGTTRQPTRSTSSFRVEPPTDGRERTCGQMPMKRKLPNTVSKRA